MKHPIVAKEMRNLKICRRKNQQVSRNKTSFRNNDLKFVLRTVHNENKTTHVLIIAKYTLLYQSYMPIYKIPSYIMKMK